MHKPRDHQTNLVTATCTLLDRPHEISHSLHPSTSYPGTNYQAPVALSSSTTPRIFSISAVTRTVTFSQSVSSSDMNLSCCFSLSSRSETAREISANVPSNSVCGGGGQLRNKGFGIRETKGEDVRCAAVWLWSLGLEH